MGFAGWGTLVNEPVVQTVQPVHVFTTLTEHDRIISTSTSIRI